MRRYKIHNIKYGEFATILFALENYRLFWFDKLYQKKNVDIFGFKLERKKYYRMFKSVEKLIRKIDVQAPEEPKNASR